MMTVFVAGCALMVFAAIALLVYPLLVRHLHGEGRVAGPKAAPLAFALAVAVALGAVGLYAQSQQFSVGIPTSAKLAAPGPRRGSGPAVRWTR